VARSALDSSSTCLYIAEELLRRNSGFFWLDHWSDDVGGSCLLLLSVSVFQIPIHSKRVLGWLMIY